MRITAPDCPTGLVVPGDKGVPAGLTSTYYKAFAPRIGMAWSPGTSGKTSFRAGWGLFYNPIEELVHGTVRRRASLRRKYFAVRRILQHSICRQDGTYQSQSVQWLHHAHAGTAG